MDALPESPSHICLAHRRANEVRYQRGRGARLKQQVEVAIRSAAATCEESGRVQRKTTEFLADSALFFLGGRVDGHIVRAYWRPVAGLKVSRRLAERAEVVIGLGDTFTAPDSGRTVSAGLDEPLQAPLTLMRASGHVEVLKLALGDLRLEFDSAR